MHRNGPLTQVVFEEGQPRRTSASVGEKQIPLFNVATDIAPTPPANVGQVPAINNVPAINVPDHASIDHADDHCDIPDEPRRSVRTPKPSQASLQSAEYRKRETMGMDEGHDWATDHSRPQALVATWQATGRELEDFIVCLLTASETKASHQIPRSYRHAMATDPNRWTIPMCTEMETLKAKHTWDLVKPPPGVNIMDSMWIYNIKWDGEGTRIKDKARLVGKGYTQQLGVDYNETWAGVTRLESVQMTAAVAAKHDLKLWRIDFVGAYLNSLTKEDIYMKQPEGFIEPGYDDYVCKLVHTIYGTMQGGHDWYETLGGTYDKLGYKTSRANPCVRIKKEAENYTITDTYTDNIFGTSNSDEEATRRKDEIGGVWEIKDVGETEYFLGMRVQQDLTLGTIRLTQRPYWEHVLNRFDLENVVPRNVPLPTSIILDSNMSPKTDSERKEMEGKPYCSILGSVMWGQLATRPDLSFSVSLLARFQANPGIEHWNTLLHVIGYIKNTVDYGLTYLRDADLSPTTFVDANYGGCRDTHRSTSGYVFMMAGGAVTWSSKRQATIALSTVEAEYVAMS